nr:hypothetical protein [Tanacetum cinerariifolium]
FLQFLHEQVYLDSLLAQRVAKEQERESRASAAQSTPRQAKLDRIALNLTNEEWIGLVDQVRRSGETLESSKSKKLKSSHSTEQSAKLPDTTSVSAGAIIAAGDPISVVPSVSTASSIPDETPIAAGVSTTAEQAIPLTKSSRRKSMARKRTLPRPSQSESAALPLDEDDPEAEFKKYLRQVSNDDEPAEPVSLSLVGRADLMVLYGMVSDKYKLERATGISLGLWLDLRTLITAREDRDASIIWDDQDQWEIRSWRFYALPAIHVL